MEYHFIGDVHGQADRLEALLRQLGYARAGSGWRHPAGRVVFLGDFIDRGPQQRRVIEIVRSMVESGNALAVMGNHERCPPWRAKRRRVVPGSREATRDTRRAEGAKGDPKGASERGVQSYGRPVCSRNELAMLWRNAG